MARSWLEILKPDEKLLNEIMEERDKERDKEREKNNLFIYVQDGMMPVEYAAGRMNMPSEKFAQEMKNAGYRVPAEGASA